MDNSVPDYYRYWGKADQDGAYHLLPYHCLDVAAVGWYLLDPKESRCICLAAQLGVEPDWLRSFFVFCLSLHDLGKFARAFQGLRTDLSSDLVKANPRMSYSERHDTLGFFLWRNNLSTLLQKRINNATWMKDVDSWLEIVTGHHGIPPKKSGERVPNFFDPDDEKAAFQFVIKVINLLLQDFGYAPLRSKEFKKRLRMVSWQLAGLSVLADWQGSDRKHFRYVEDYKKLPEYWDEIALPSAKKAVQSMPEKPMVRQFHGFRDLFPKTLFPKIRQPTLLQKYAIDEPLGDSPQLFILEDVTGAGKTEAALTLVHRMLEAGLADGLYVALPTMATANAMYDRLGEVYRRFYGAGEHPSLILAHGARDLSDTFVESVSLPENQPGDQGYSAGDENQMPEFSATLFCNAWLADRRKKALLADVGVGTLDQALLAVLPARHQSLRLLGLNRKILLVDEVHAYDCYMQKLLDALLEAHARQRGSAILLSATLPQNMRQDLVTAFHRGLEVKPFEISNVGYPLATHTPAVDDCEKEIDTREDVKRTVMVKRLEQEDSAIDLIRQTVAKGQCVCWIRNTVKAARQIHRQLAECEWLDREHLHLFHSRFAMVDRKEIESTVKRMFGEKSSRSDRKGQVLIATQVVEQSLDLDFDVLITDLAPIDLVIQRAGRLQRHVRDARGNRIEELNAGDQRDRPILYLFSPDPANNIDANWLKKHQKGTQAVYPHIGQLWLTAKLLLEDFKSKFTMPDDARQLIEGVYSYKAEEKIPEILLDASREAIAKAMSYKSVANMNALKMSQGYTGKSGNWDEESRIPTRLSETETISVVLALYRDGKLIPYAGNVKLPWVMSTVKIPEHEWKKAKDEIPLDMKILVDNLKSNEKSVCWLEVFPLNVETANYYDTLIGWQPQGENI